MWSRVELKTRAKVVLKKYYWKMFAVSMVILLAGGSEHGGDSGNSNSREKFVGTISPEMAIFLKKMAVIFSIMAIVLLILRIVVGYTLEVGGRKFFIRAAEDECNFSYLGLYFRQGRYGGVVGTMFTRTIYLILWTLLLIIPGIIKSYAYRMVPYILADNPSIGTSRAIELSNEMTNGEKWNMFVLDLSFIGWYLLGLLALGIGVLFVMPYEDATKAELYLHLRERAVERGFTSTSELNLIEVEEL
jgi:uncharacterized membrane protein